jgi:hypothetical protein
MYKDYSYLRYKDYVINVILDNYKTEYTEN